MTHKLKRNYVHLLLGVGTTTINDQPVACVQFLDFYIAVDTIEQSIRYRGIWFSICSIRIKLPQN